MLVAFTACQKELENPSLNAGETLFSIEANLDPFADESELDTKAGANAVVRLNWSAGDKISVINMTTGKALGGDLTAQQSGSSSTFSGSLSGTLRSGDRLAFIYPSQGYTTEQTFTGATIDFSNQSGSSTIPLAVSAVMTYNGSSTQNLYLDFTYLMSYFQLNLSELPKSTSLTNVRFYGMGAKTVLSINSAKDGLASTAQDGMIKVESSNLASNAKGAKTVYIAGFASPSQDAREVRVKASGKSYKTTWTTAALSVGKFYTSIINSFQQFEEPAEVTPGGGSDTHYVDEYGVDRGAGFEITETIAGENRTVVWAPVNLGYSDSYPYGKLYQWGRKAGQGYGSANSNDEAGNRVAVAQSTATAGSPLINPANGTFYTVANSTVNDWYASTEFDQIVGEWNQMTATSALGNPCPDGWRIPTKAELEGLMQYKSAWVTSNGQGGYCFKGNKSSLANDAALFLPAAGYRYNTNGAGTGRESYGHYWAAQSDQTNAYGLVFYNGSASVLSSSRAVGRSIRCVLSVGDLPTITTTSASKVGSSYAIIGGDITSDGGDAISSKGLVWGTTSAPTITSCIGLTDEGANSSSFSSYASALNPQTSYYIRAYATNSKGTAYGNAVRITTTAVEKYIDAYGADRGNAVTIVEKVDGQYKAVVWAPVNLGYSKSYPYGLLYQWGRKVGQGYGTANDYDEAGNMVKVETSPAEPGMPLVFPDAGAFYTKDSSPYDWYAATTGEQFKVDWNDIQSDEYVGNPCPEGWRVPTRYELEGLNANKSSWTSKDEQNGYYFRGSNGDLPDGASVFLPASGYRDNNGDSQSRGFYYSGYWSSSTYSSYGYSYNLYFTLLNPRVSIDAFPRGYGYSVRCVLDESSTPVTSVTKTLPAVSKPSLSGEAGSTMAIISAEVTKAGGQEILERGIVWGTTSSVTLSSCSGSSKAEIADVGRSLYVVSGIPAGSSSYFRAYARNASGTVYSDAITITTKAIKSMAYIDENGINRGNGIEIYEMVDGAAEYVIWAPVNLGYSESYPYGKLYQWGRKAGQGYGSANSNDEAGNRVIVESSPAEPGMPFIRPDAGTFYTYVNTTTYDWYAATMGEQFNIDWNEISSDDYVGNPCPDGWRVPTEQELDGLKAHVSSRTTKGNQNGYYFMGALASFHDASTVFLPASGYRRGGGGDKYFPDGDSDGRGDYGYYWSSTPNSNYAYYLSLSNSGSGIGIFTNKRDKGSSIRCVLE